MNEILESVSIIDTETTNCLPVQAEIVEIASTIFRDGKLESDSMLFSTKEPIPFEAMATHNITNKMVQGLPLFTEKTNEAADLLKLTDHNIAYFVAHNCQYDQKVLKKQFSEAGDVDLVDLCSKNEYWLCTMRLAKHLLPDANAFNLSYLRYFLDLDIDENNAHRATIDTIVCAKLFEKLVEIAFAKGFYDLNALCWSPIMVQKMPFGKYRGLSLKDVPTDYYMWMFKTDILNPDNEDNDDFDSDLYNSILLELESRVI